MKSKHSTDLNSTLTLKSMKSMKSMNFRLLMSNSTTHIE